MDISLVAWMVFLTSIWGLNAVTIKWLTMDITPFMAAGLRGLLATVLLTLFGLWRRESLLFRGMELIHALVIGGMFGLEFAFIFFGAPFTTGGHVSIFVNTAPFFVALGAHWFFPHERMHLVKLAGLVVAFAGVVVLFSDELYVQQSGFWRGDLLVLCGAFMWGATTLYMKRYLVVTFSAFRLLYAQVLFSTIFLLGLSWVVEPEPFLHTSETTWLILGFQGVVVVCFSYLMWMHLLRFYQASAMQSFTFLTPVWGVLAGIVLLGERATVLLLLGMALVGAGLFLVSRPRKIKVA